MARWRKWDSRFADEVLTEDLSSQDPFEAGEIAINHSMGRGKTQELVKQLVISKTTLDAVLKRYGEDTWSNRSNDGASASMSGVRPTNVPPTQIVRAKWSGRGRALALKRRVLEQSQRRPGHTGCGNTPVSKRVTTEPKEGGSTSNVEKRSKYAKSPQHPQFTWTMDENTLCFCNIPLSQTEETLRDVINDFGTVTHCTILPTLNEAGLKTAYVRMEKHSACDWVISCFHGNPFDDLYAEDVACFFALQ